MTREEVARMAREADPFGKDGRLYAIAELTPDTLERFAALVAAAERESCAQIVESIAAQYTEPTWAYQILRAIRGD